MKEKESDKTGTWIIRDVPLDLMRRTRMAAIAEGTTVKELFVVLAEAHIKEMEKKGVLPKGK